MSKHFNEAVATFKCVLEDSSAPRELKQKTRLSLATLLHSSKDKVHQDLCITELKALTFEDPDDLNYSALLACTLHENNHFEEALAIYKTLHSVDSIEENVLIAQTNEALALKDLNASKKVCEKWEKASIGRELTKRAKCASLAVNAFLLLDFAAGSDPVKADEVKSAVRACEELKEFAVSNGLKLSHEALVNAGVASALAAKVGL